MRTDPCQCGQSLFFDNTQCIRCRSQVGFCDVCHRMTALEPTGDGGFRCFHPSCGAELALCYHNELSAACNWTIAQPSTSAFCISCELTDVVPDLNDPTLRTRWERMEAAKRRLLYTLIQIPLPFRRSDSAASPALRFHFPDPETASEPVMTGHANGVITINLNEADSVEREKSRVELREPQRTLIGHFRHEIGHYYWEVFVKDRAEETFRDVFGDERSPTYEAGRQRYYEEGPLPDWKASYISGYATMHPWEDFAETFACYLDVASVLDTAVHNEMVEEPPDDFAERIKTYKRLAVMLNETTRERGLVDLIPEVLTQPVIQKLHAIHELLSTPV